jgi:anion transporter
MTAAKAGQRDARPVLTAWMAPLLVALASIGIGLWLAASGFSARQAMAAAAIAFAMACWATNALPEMTTGLAFFALATLGRIAEPKVIFGGFASSAFWLVLGGMIVAQAMTRTGLGRRIASAVAAPLSKSYPRLVLGTVLIAYLLAFLMPSNIGRIVLLMPIMLAIADRVGLAEGRAGRTGIVLAVGFGTFVLSTTILPANVPNLIMAGAIESLYGIHLSYLDYLVLHTPLLGLAKAALLIALICRIFPDKIASVAITAETAPMSPEERRLALLLVATLAMWLTEGIHGIAPAWIGLAAAVVCLLPGIGMLPPDTFNAINHRTLLYVAALLGVVAVLSDTGLGDALARLVLSWLPLHHGANAWNFALLVLLSFAISLVASANGVGAIYTAFAGDLVTATGLPLLSVLMIQVLGFSTVAFAYQAPPIMVALGLGNAAPADAARIGVPLALLTFLVLLPLDFVWWRLLGMI